MAHPKIFLRNFLPLLLVTLLFTFFSIKKINTKNAFQLKLIDYMGDIVLNQEIGGGTTNFQVCLFKENKTLSPFFGVLKCSKKSMNKLIFKKKI